MLSDSAAMLTGGSWRIKGVAKKKKSFRELGMEMALAWDLEVLQAEKGLSSSRDPGFRSPEATGPP